VRVHENNGLCSVDIAAGMRTIRGVARESEMPCLWLGKPKLVDKTFGLMRVRVACFGIDIIDNLS